MFSSNVSVFVNVAFGVGGVVENRLMCGVRRTSDVTYLSFTLLEEQWAQGKGKGKVGTEEQ